MQLNSDAPPLAVELRDPEIRQHTVESQIKIGIPFQIRAMREHRGWTQGVLAGKIGTTQNTISRLENPKTGKPTITTLLRIANACDVGLLVRFVPFGFYGDVIDAMDQTHVEVPSYDEELKSQAEAERASVAAVAATSGHIMLRDLAGMTANPDPAFFLRMAEADAAYKTCLASYTEQLNENTKAASRFFESIGLTGSTTIAGMMNAVARASQATNQLQRTATSTGAGYIDVSESSISTGTDYLKTETTPQPIRVQGKPDRKMAADHRGKNEPQKRRRLGTYGLARSAQTAVEAIPQAA